MSHFFWIAPQNL